MYNKFDTCIYAFSHESNPGDYWYDCAILEATELLKKFSKNDWELLLKELALKPIFWQKRLVECLGDLHNTYELDVIFYLIDTDNDDLFVDCVDSLRSLSLAKLDSLKKEQLTLKAKALLDKASLPVKCVLDSVVNKF